jgi:hypothetical protein
MSSFELWRRCVLESQRRHDRHDASLSPKPRYEWQPAADSMNSDSRIAARYLFESRILVRVRRGERKVAAQGWARDLSESGLGAFVADNLLIGELVTLEIPLGGFGKTEIAAKVARKVGTQCGFQFTALSAGQRLGIQAVLSGQKAIPYSRRQRAIS